MEGTSLLVEAMGFYVFRRFDHRAPLLLHHAAHDFSSFATAVTLSYDALHTGTSRPAQLTRQPTDLLERGDVTALVRMASLCSPLTEG